MWYSLVNVPRCLVKKASSHESAACILDTRSRCGGRGLAALQFLGVARAASSAPRIVHVAQRGARKARRGLMMPATKFILPAIDRNLRFDTVAAARMLRSSAHMLRTLSSGMVTETEEW